MVTCIGVAEDVAGPSFSSSAIARAVSATGRGSQASAWRVPKGLAVGPSSPGNFAGLGTVTGMRACHTGSYRLDNSPAAAYEDNVVSWPSVEPALDYSAISLLAFALAAQGSG